VHSGRVLVLLAGDTPRLDRALATDTPLDLVELVRTSFIGRALGLMIRAYPTGIGTHPQGR
jgi:hypothetical protein